MFVQNKKSWDTIVIGAGQASLATGYYLQSLQADFIILDASDRIGDSWRSRWDSLTLFTPNWANALPGYPFPGASHSHAGKDEVADYLMAYAGKFSLPILPQTKVTGLAKTREGYEITSRRGTFYCKNVVLANGGYARPKLPAFAGDLDPGIHQLHSSAYRSPSDLPEGDVLVVGAGTSGIQIAIDIARDRRTAYLAGHPPVKIPDLLLRFFGKPVIWAMNNIITINTPIGRKAEYAIKTGGKAAPLINTSIEQAEKAGVEHVPRLRSVQNGYPVLENGVVMTVPTIIWCTGFSCDLSWIDIRGLTDSHGYPIASRGVSKTHEGLYFIGMPFQYALTSSWINGVGRDAAYIAGHIRSKLS